MKEGRGPKQRRRAPKLPKAKTLRDSYLAASGDSLPEDAFVLDSGASHHMVGERSHFKNYRETGNHPISLADNSTIHAIGTGREALKSGDKTIKIRRQDNRSHRGLACPKTRSTTSSISAAPRVERKEGR